MFDRDLDGRDEAAVLAALRPAQDHVDVGETQLLRLAGRWADLHAVLRPEWGPMLIGSETLLPLGGEGTPPLRRHEQAQPQVELGRDRPPALPADAVRRQPTAVSQRARRSGVLHGLEEVGAMAVLVVLVAAALYAASEWILWRS